MNTGSIWLDLLDQDGDPLGQICAVPIVPRPGEQIVDEERSCTFTVTVVRYVWGKKNVFGGYAESRDFRVEVFVK